MKIRKVNCLIDFFSEEIPASMQLFLEKELNHLFEKVLNKVLLNFEKIEILSSKIKKIKLLNPKKNEYQKLSDQRNLNKNSKKI